MTRYHYSVAGFSFSVCIPEKEKQLFVFHVEFSSRYAYLKNSVNTAISLLKTL